MAVVTFRKRGRRKWGQRARKVTGGSKSQLQPVVDKEKEKTCKTQKAQSSITLKRGSVHIHWDWIYSFEKEKKPSHTWISSSKRVTREKRHKGTNITLHERLFDVYDYTLWLWIPENDIIVRVLTMMKMLVNFSFAAPRKVCSVLLFCFLPQILVTYNIPHNNVKYHRIWGFCVRKDTDL